MSIREIPRSFVYTCDACGIEHLQENAGGHYTDSRPPLWERLKLHRTAVDYQGTPCADASIERLLCDRCAAIISKAVNEATLKIQSKDTKNEL